MYLIRRESYEVRSQYFHCCDIGATCKDQPSAEAGWDDEFTWLTVRSTDEIEIRERRTERSDKVGIKDFSQQNFVNRIRSTSTSYITFLKRIDRYRSDTKPICKGIRRAYHQSLIHSLHNLIQSILRMTLSMATTKTSGFTIWRPMINRQVHMHFQRSLFAFF